MSRLNFNIFLKGKSAHELSLQVAEYMLLLDGSDQFHPKTEVEGDLHSQMKKRKELKEKGDLTENVSFSDYFFWKKFDNQSYLP